MLESIETLGVVVALLVTLSLTVPVFCTITFRLGVDFVQMGQCSPHLHSFSAGLLLWALFSTRAWGMAANLGGIFSSAFSILITVGASIGRIGQDTLASNKFMETGMVLSWGVLPVLWDCGSDCSFRLLLLLGIVTGGVERPSSSWGFLVG